jgi:hypothetical protein
MNQVKKRSLQRDKNAAKEQAAQDNITWHKLAYGKVETPKKRQLCFQADIFRLRQTLFMFE